MISLRFPSAALAAACVCLSAFAADNPYAPPTPVPPAASTAPQDGNHVTTTTERGKPALPANLLSPILGRIQMPQASGAVRVAPADAAVIVVVVPAAADEVLFDGARTYTEGTTRTFVTPPLPDGKPAAYKVAVQVGRDGDATMKEREIEAPAGRITVVDFTRPEGK